MSGQPYSESAMTHAKGVCQGRVLTGWAELEEGAAAMHDRETLGLDASVCARTFLNEIIGKVQKLQEGALGAGDDFSAGCYGTVANVLYEFGEQS